MNLFNVTNQNIAHGDFMYFVADVFSGMVQYSKVRQLCERISPASWSQDAINNFAQLAYENGENADPYDADY